MNQNQKVSLIFILSLIVLTFSSALYSQVSHKQLNKNEFLSQILKKERYKLIEKTSAYPVFKNNSTSNKVDSLIYLGRVSSKTETEQVKRLYDYNERTKVERVIEAVYDPSSEKYIPTSKVETVAKSTTREVQTHYRWDLDQEEFVVDSKIEINWKDIEHLNPVSKTFYTFEEGEFEEVKHERYEYVDYLDIFLLKLNVNSTWNGAGWENETKSEMEYKEDTDDLTQKTDYLWNQGISDWNNKSKDLYTYNENGQNINWILLFWDENSAYWENNTQGRYTYNPEGNLENSEIDYWSGDDWQQQARVVYSYAPGTQLLNEYTESLWNQNSQSWNESWKAGFTYNDLKKITENLYQIKSENDWINFSREQYQYNATGDCASGNSDRWYEKGWEPALEHLGFEDEFGNYFGFRCTEFDAYYSEVVGVENVEDFIENYSLFPNYPNPFNPSTSIGFRIPEVSKVDISIYNLLGQKIASVLNREFNVGSHTVQWDARELANGLYFIKMTAFSVNGNNSFSKTQKAILLK